MTGDSRTPGGHDARLLLIRSDGGSLDTLGLLFARRAAGAVSRDIVRCALAHIATHCAPAARQRLPFGCAVALTGGAERFRFGTGADVLPIPDRAGFVIQTERDVTLDGERLFVLPLNVTFRAGAGFVREPSVTVLAFARDVTHPFQHCAAVAWDADGRIASACRTRLPQENPGADDLLALLAAAAVTV